MKDNDDCLLYDFAVSIVGDVPTRDELTDWCRRYPDRARDLAELACDMYFDHRQALWVEHGWRLGAQACREMMARFVEQGGDAVTAASIRANWNPRWGDDPGAVPADEPVPSFNDG